MNCADIEILICDCVDGTLRPEQTAALERHLAECPACAALARDSAEAVQFMERVAEVEPPPELINRILFHAPWNKSDNRSGWRKWLEAALSPLLQPRFAMGLSMTFLTLSIMWTTLGGRQLKPDDLKPAKLWIGLEDRAYRTWTRTVKFYDNLKVVYQIQTTLREWQQQDEELQKSAPAGDSSNPKTDERKLPVKPVSQRSN